MIYIEKREVTFDEFMMEVVEAAMLRGAQGNVITIKCNKQDFDKISNMPCGETFTELRTLILNKNPAWIESMKRLKNPYRCLSIQYSGVCIFIFEDLITTPLSSILNFEIR